MFIRQIYQKLPVIRLKVYYRNSQIDRNVDRIQIWIIDRQKGGQIINVRSQNDK